MADDISVTSNGSSSLSGSTSDFEEVKLGSPPGGQPRRSSVDSGQLQQVMADVLDEEDNAGGLTGTESDGRATPTPGGFDPEPETTFIDDVPYGMEFQGQVYQPHPNQDYMDSQSDSSSDDFQTSSPRQSQSKHKHKHRKQSQPRPEVSPEPESNGDQPDNLVNTDTAAPPADNQSESPKSPLVDSEYTTFHGVTYLGAAAVNAPRSENEIKRNMAILNDHTSMAISVYLMIPSNPDGVVRERKYGGLNKEERGHHDSSKYFDSVEVAELWDALGISSSDVQASN